MKDSKKNPPYASFNCSALEFWLGLLMCVLSFFGTLFRTRLGPMSLQGKKKKNTQRKQLRQKKKRKKERERERERERESIGTLKSTEKNNNNCQKQTDIC